MVRGRQLFSHLYIRVMRLGECALETHQLLIGERSARAPGYATVPLLPRLQDDVWVKQKIKKLHSPNFLK